MNSMFASVYQGQQGEDEGANEDDEAFHALESSFHADRDSTNLFSEVKTINDQINYRLNDRSKQSNQSMDQINQVNRSDQSIY